MSPANQDRFENCIELVGTDEMPPESLATVVSGMMRKQSQSANKSATGLPARRDVAVRWARQRGPHVSFQKLRVVVVSLFVNSIIHDRAADL